MGSTQNRRMSPLLIDHRLFSTTIYVHSQMSEVPKIRGVLQTELQNRVKPTFDQCQSVGFIWQNHSRSHAPNDQLLQLADSLTTSDRRNDLPHGWNSIWFHVLPRILGAWTVEPGPPAIWEMAALWSCHQRWPLRPSGRFSNQRSPPRSIGLHVCKTLKHIETQRSTESTHFKNISNMFKCSWSEELWVH